MSKLYDYLKKQNDPEANELLHELQLEEIYRNLRFYIENYKQELVENLKLDDVDFVCKYGFSSDWKAVFREYELNVKEIKRILKEILENEAIQWI